MEIGGSLDKAPRWIIWKNDEAAVVGWGRMWWEDQGGQTLRRERAKRAKLKRAWNSDSSWTDIPAQTGRCYQLCTFLFKLPNQWKTPRDTEESAFPRRKHRPHCRREHSCLPSLLFASFHHQSRWSPPGRCSHPPAAWPRWWWWQSAGCKDTMYSPRLTSSPAQDFTGT